MQTDVKSMMWFGIMEAHFCLICAPQTPWIAQLLSVLKLDALDLHSAPVPWKNKTNVFVLIRQYDAYRGRFSLTQE